MLQNENQPQVTETQPNGNDQPINLQEVTTGDEPKDKAQGNPSAEAGNADTKKQSKAENARYAEERRKREAAEAEAKAKNTANESKTYEDGYRQAQLDSNKVNKYTDEPITNAHELEIYLDMKKLDEEGKDPLKAYPAFLAQKLAEADKKAAEEEEKAKQAEEQKRTVSKQIADWNAELKKAHPELDVAELKENKAFQEFAKDKYGRWSYLELYEGFLATQGKISEKKKPQGTPSSVQTQYTSKKEVKDMTLDEYEAYRKEKYGY